MTTGTDTISENDVIQLDPRTCEWGPLFCIVSDVKSWGVQAYWLQATERNKPPGKCFIRVEHGNYIKIGSAEWIVGSASSEEPEAGPPSSEELEDLTTWSDDPVHSSEEEPGA